MPLYNLKELNTMSDFWNDEEDIEVPRRNKKQENRKRRNKKTYNTKEKTRRLKKRRRVKKVPIFSEPDDWLDLDFKD